MGGEQPRVVTAAHLKRSSQFGGRVTDEVALVANSLHIGVSEMNDFAHALASGLLGRAPRPENDDVLAEGVHHLLVTALKALADGDHEYDRSDSPRDSKHRQRA